jgi:hypothetical protein
MLEAELGRDDSSQRHFQRALSIARMSLPEDHPYTVAMLYGYSALLRKTGHKRDAAKLERQARTMQVRRDHENFTDLTVDVRNLLR